MVLIGELVRQVPSSLGLVKLAARLGWPKGLSV